MLLSYLLSLGNLQAVAGCTSALHVPHVMLLVHPTLASNLQGHFNVNRGALAVNDLGNGGDWQQFKLDWALLANVVGQ